MKLETSWKSKIGVTDVNQSLVMLRWPQLPSCSTLNTPSNPKLMIFPSTIKSVSIGYILPGKTVYRDISSLKWFSEIAFKEYQVEIYHDISAIYHWYICKNIIYQYDIPIYQRYITKEIYHHPIYLFLEISYHWYISDISLIYHQHQTVVIMIYQLINMIYTWYIIWKKK